MVVRSALKGQNPVICFGYYKNGYIHDYLEHTKHLFKLMVIKIIKI